MPTIQRKGDANSAGGIITSGDPSVRIGGRDIAVEGSPVSSHPCCGQRGCPPSHCNARTTASGTLRVNGKRVTLTGDVDTCGHARIGGDPTVKSS